MIFGLLIWPPGAKSKVQKGKIYACIGEVIKTLTDE